MGATPTRHCSSARDRGAAPSATRRTAMKASGLAALGIAALALPRASAAASPGPDTSAGQFYVGAYADGCGRTAGPPQEADFNVFIELEAASVSAGNDYRLSLDGDVAGPWLETVSDPIISDGLMYFEYRIVYEVTSSDEGGCNDPIYRQLKGQVTENDVVVRPDFLVGLFVEGAFVASYPVTEWLEG